jgi:hypothetical protein
MMTPRERSFVWLVDVMALLLFGNVIYMLCSAR